MRYVSTTNMSNARKQVTLFAFLNVAFSLAFASFYFNNRSHPSSDAFLTRRGNDPEITSVCSETHFPFHHEFVKHN